MAVRPVFIVKESSPFYSIWNCEFEYNSGFSTVQKQKNIAAIHRSFEDVFPQKRILEISSKSTKELGVRLSAFNLTKHVPELGRSVPTECVYQAGKVFAGNVQYKDLLGATPKDAKRDERLSSSGRIVAFSFDGAEYPTDPPTAFYDFLYKTHCSNIKTCLLNCSNTTHLPISNSTLKKALTAKQEQQPSLSLLHTEE